MKIVLRIAGWFVSIFALLFAAASLALPPHTLQRTMAGLVLILLSVVINPIAIARIGILRSPARVAIAILVTAALGVVVAILPTASKVDQASPTVTAEDPSTATSLATTEKDPEAEIIKAALAADYPPVAGPIDDETIYNVGLKCGTTYMYYFKTADATGLSATLKKEMETRARRYVSDLTLAAMAMGKVEGIQEDTENYVMTHVDPAEFKANLPFCGSDYAAKDEQLKKVSAFAKAELEKH